jgi:hypothetical protein
MTSSQSIAADDAVRPWADRASDACASLVDARTALYSMMNAKDKSAQDALNDAKKITDGIQYERLSKMWSIMSCK